MSTRRVKVTWKLKAPEGYREEIITEICDLIDEEHKIVDSNGEELPDILAELAKEGYVIFEDEEGLFCLFPDQVLHIELV